MASLVFPAALPTARADGHSFEPQEIARNVEFDAGEPRVRRLYRTAPSIARVMWSFTQSEFAAFHAFHEDDLIAGERVFFVPLARQGVVGLSYWAARFVEVDGATYQASAKDGGRWDVSAVLLLTGEPSDAPPSGVSVGAWLIPVYPDTEQLAFFDPPPAYVPWAAGASGVDTTKAWGWAAPWMWVHPFESDGAAITTQWAPASPDDWAPTLSQVDADCRIEPSGSMFGWGGGVLTIGFEGSPHQTVVTFTPDVWYAVISWEYVDV